MEDGDAIEAAYEMAQQARLLVPVWVEWRGQPTDLVNNDIHGRKLRVLTKSASIVSSPEILDYPGGSWPIEGQINEGFVCTVLFQYYDSENITTSQLVFRALFTDPYYERNDNIEVASVLRLRDEIITGFLVSNVEFIEAPGHCKIICLFVVDPNKNKAMVTDRVPLQQREWRVKDILESKFKLTSKLPLELFNRVFDLIELIHGF